jgi:hypothetical protein
VKPGRGDIPVRVKIEGEELRELKALTGSMAEAFGLDRRIEAYQGKRPLQFYRWDRDCLVDVVDLAIQEAHILEVADPEMPEAGELGLQVAEHRVLRVPASPRN